jgi:5-methylcytosine-specific restriction endonuclease McrA
MPRASKACSGIGCTRLVPPGKGGKCESCKVASTKQSGTWGTQRTATKLHRELRQQCLKRDKNRCQYKGLVYGRAVRCQTYGWTADHIIPKAAGGADILANYRTICEACHAVKTGVEGRFAQAVARGDNMPCPWDDSRHDLKEKLSDMPPTQPRRQRRRTRGGYDPASWTRLRPIGLDPLDDD